MAEAAAARREARRRKILENSHNRLQIISGKSPDECPRDSPIRSIVADHNHEVPESSDISSSKTPFDNGVIFNEPQLNDLLSSLSRDIASGDVAVPNDLASFLTPPPVASPIPEPGPTQSLWEKCINYRYDIVWLSIMVQCLNCLSLVQFENTYFFLPVLIYVITKLMIFPIQSNSKLGNALMLLQGLASYRVKKVIFLTQCSSVIFGDICVYLFTTICIQSLLNTLKDSFIT